MKMQCVTLVTDAEKHGCEAFRVFRGRVVHVSAPNFYAGMCGAYSETRLPVNVPETYRKLCGACRVHMESRLESGGW